MITFRQTHSLVTRSKLPASDYVINPYIGCTHRCAYCYARFMGRFTGHTEAWGTYIEARKYESMRLPKDIAGKTVLIGSVTDAYNPCEKQVCLMPEILKALKDSGAHVEILTKSALVARDLDIIKSIPDVAVGFSLSNLLDADNGLIEPGASTALERLNAMRILHENGVKTYVFIAPYLPYITDVEAIVNAAEGSADWFCVENLNLRGEARPMMLALIDKLHPELSEKYRDIYLHGGAKAYWENVEEELQRLESSLGVKLISYMYHDKIKKR